MTADSRAQPRVVAFELYDPTGKALDWLASRGVDVVLGNPLWVMPFERWSEDELIARAQGCVALMGASGTTITKRVIEAIPSLRYIAKYGVGVDSIDIEAATRHGVIVCNTPDERQIYPVSEHAVAMMLALAKQFWTWTPEFMRKAGWRGLTHSVPMRGSTVGIIGLGRIGRGVAQRLAGWEANIVAYDPFASDVPAGVEMVTLEALLARADFVTLHASPSPDNRHLLNARTLKLMKPSAYVVNTGRGSLIDYAALRDALERKAIAGAALDVFDREPPAVDDPLFSMPNVICTPHVAAWTKDGVEAIGWHAARNLWALLSGEGRADIVNPQARTQGRAIQDAS